LDSSAQIRHLKVHQKSRSLLNMKIIIISDFFCDEVLGGGEINDQVLYDCLLESGHEVLKIKSQEVDLKFINKNSNAKFIVSNFALLRDDVKVTLEFCEYIIYEHDHKYLTTRNPAMFKGYRAPDTFLTNVSFYRNAKAVFCQSNLHSEILLKNIPLENIRNVGGNLWSNQQLDYIASLTSIKKRDRFSIMDSSIEHKNTKGAISYCEKIGKEYELIKGSYFDFLKAISLNDKLAFFPKTPETLSRLVVEARMLEIEVHTNSLVGAVSEGWFHLKGPALIDFLRKKRQDVVDSIKETFTVDKIYYNILPNLKPKVSLITSLYDGDLFISDFLKDITDQTIFEDCELIIVDANSPGNERAEIEKYQNRFPNIKYHRTKDRISIYSAWNVGISLSDGKYLSNTNLDDRRSKQQLEILVDLLEENSDLDLSYSECLMTRKPNETFAYNSSLGEVYPVSSFSRQAMIKCLPGCMPVWRREVHDAVGVFDEDYKYAGDWEMWLRMVRRGSKFIKKDCPLGLYYMNPEGLSTSHKNEVERYREEQKIFWEYTDVFGEKMTSLYAQHFGRKV